MSLKEIVTIVTSTITAVAAGVGAWVAVSGIQAWKKQLKGKTDYELARRYLRAVYKTRDAIKFVRNPFVSIEEIDKAAKEKNVSSTSIDDGGIRGVYSRRWDKVVEAGSDLSVELLEAEVSWGKGALEIEKDFDVCRRKLFADLKIFLSFGLNLGKRPDPKEHIIYDMGEGDTYNAEMEKAILKIEEYLKPHLR